MAETEAKIEALKEQTVEEANAVNPQADAPKKNAVAAEPSHLSNEAEDLGAAVVKPTDSNPDATKKVKEVSGDPQQKAEVAPEASHLKKEEAEAEEGSEEEIKETAEEETKEVAEEVIEEEDNIDVTADVDALVANEDLSEEFKSKAATIFEAALKSKVSEMKKKMYASYDKKMKEDLENEKAALVEKVDSYLNYVVEEWMKENEIALERGIKGEIAEDFISGLKKLFEDHYIDVPDEKYNVLEDQASKIDDLEKKLNESIEKNVELTKVNGEMKKAEIVKEAASDLSDVAKEKFNKLAEEVDYTSETDFRAKVDTIKESYFGAKKDVSSDIDDVAVGETTNVDLSESMAAYTAAITKTKDIKLSK